MANVMRSSHHTYINNLTLAIKSLVEAKADINDGYPESAYTNLVHCYLHIVTFLRSFESEYADERMALRVDPDVLEIVHMMAVRKLLDIESLIMSVYSYKDPFHVKGVDFIRTMLVRNPNSVDISRILDRMQVLLDKRPSRESGERDDEAGVIANPADTILPKGLIKFDMSVAKGFDSIVGQDTAVQDIRAYVTAAYQASRSVSMVLYGPPGTGKTSIALAIGMEYGLDVYSVSVTELGGAFVGERESSLEAIFTHLSAVPGRFILFIDEAESFIRLPQSHDQASVQFTRGVTVSAIKKLLKRTENPCLIIMATNYLGLIAPEITSVSRSVFIGLPDSLDAVRRIAEYYRQRYRVNMSTEQFDRLTGLFKELEYAPAYINLSIERMASTMLMAMLKRGGRLVSLSDAAVQGSLVTPAFTVSNMKVFDCCSESKIYVVENEIGPSSRLPIHRDALFPLYLDDIGTLLETIRPTKRPQQNALTGQQLMQ